MILAPNQRASYVEFLGSKGEILHIEGTPNPN